jgi:hypothetical protein
MSITNGDENGVIAQPSQHADSPFERIKRVNDSGAGMVHRDFAGTSGTAITATSKACSARRGWRVFKAEIASRIISLRSPK